MFSETGEAAPVKNIVVSGGDAMAPARDSLFFPLAQSLHRPLGALLRQARAARRDRSNLPLIYAAKQKHHPDGWCFVWRRRRDLNSRAAFYGSLRP